MGVVVFSRFGGKGIGRDECLWAEQPVDAQQVLWRVVGIGFGESVDLGIRFVTERLYELLPGIVECHFPVVV